MPTPTLNFRASAQLQKAASAKARRLGIPLTVVLRSALVQFVHDDHFTIQESDIEILPVPKSLQKKMDMAMNMAAKLAKKAKPSLKK